MRNPRRPSRLRRWGAALGLAMVGATVASSSALAAGGPDLRLSAVSAQPTEVSPTEAPSIHYAVRNRGDAAAGASTVRLFLSRDSTRGRDDIRIGGSYRVPGLLPGRSAGATVSALVPSGTPAGTYRLLACADARHEVTESSETNNCRAPITVTVRAPATLLAAGDISDCAHTGDRATAALLGRWPGATVAALGDDAYENGSPTDFSCYGDTWGTAKARTRPAVGNHEYQTPGAAGYFSYFGSRAGDPTKGYYSYDLGTWHVVVLNTSDGCRAVSCGAGSPQEEWLRADLAAHPARCTLAYWHHPLFSSDGNVFAMGEPAVRPLWKDLYAAGADVILNGHSHIYERWAPQRPDGTTDPAHGIREFIAGTGGYAEHQLAQSFAPNSETRDNQTFGVLKLDLGASSYRWQFVPASAGGYTDSGSQSCH